jgi:hypothetical protein
MAPRRGTDLSSFDGVGRKEAIAPGTPGSLTEQSLNPLYPV